MVAYSFKRQFVAPIRIGLGKEVFDAAYRSDSVVLRPKRQTIRAIGKRRHARVGETLQLYTAMRTKQFQLIGKARCTVVRHIIITFGKLSGVSVGGIYHEPEAHFQGAGLDVFA